MNSKDYSLLRNHIETFSKLTDADWELLLPHLTLKKLRKNELFIREGKKAAELGFVLNGMLRLYYIEALSDTSYISFPYKILVQLFEQSMAWQKFGRMIAEYAVIGLEERMVGLLLESPEERYLGLLKSNKKKIIERIPQHYIANYLGITPVSMSRIRSRILKNK
jgi:CRP-like cAMP-binding protein